MSNILKEVDFADESTCVFCGQVNMESAEDCDCWGAVRHRRITEQTAKARTEIKALFGGSYEGYPPLPETVVEILQAAARQIIHGEAYAMQLVLPEGIKAKLTRGAKGALKVERTETSKFVQEVEE